MKRPLVYYEFEPAAEVAFPVAYMNWFHIVGAYNKLALTFSLDKLPAIAGVAREFQKTIKSQYVAGMWRSHLLGQLLWTTLDLLRRPAEYRAPTWSWASVDGTFQLDPRDLVLTGTESRGDEQKDTSSNVVLAEIMDVQVALLAGEAETGRIQKGHLRMRGRLVPVSELLTGGYCQKRDVDPSPYIRQFQMQYPHGAKLPEIFDEITIDVVHQCPLDGDYFCVPFYISQEDKSNSGTASGNDETESSSHCRGLILRATRTTKGQLERSGTFRGGFKAAQYFCDDERKSEVVDERCFLEMTSDNGFPTYEFAII